MDINKQQISPGQGGAQQQLADNTEELELTAFQKGLSCLSAGDVGKAFACFLLALKVNPDRKEIVVPLTSSLLQWCSKLLRIDRVDDALSCCKTSIAILPGSAHLWYAFGMCLNQLDMRNEALSAFYKALQLQPAGMPCARWAADMLLHELMERWHFPMINDVARNALYAAAIAEGVQLAGKDADALDIGCGTGLLSMFALRAGLQHIHAVEMSPLMHNVCQQALVGNGYSNSVSLKLMSSNELTIPEHISRRVSLVVSEIMDCALLGEHVVPSMRYAWKHLLCPPSLDGAAPSRRDEESSVAAASSCVQVIPSCASVHATLTECVTTRHCSRLLTGSVMGLDFSQLQLVGSDHLDKSAADLQQTLLVGRDSVRTAEPYTTEDFSHVRGGACPLQHCSPAESLLMRVNFADPEVPITLTGDCVSFVVDRCGYLDTVAVSFNATLIGDKVISTSPFCSLTTNTAWHQASFPVTAERFRSADCWRDRLQGLCSVCLALDHAANSVRVCKGDTVELSVNVGSDDTLLGIGIVDIKRSQMPENSSPVQSGGDSKPPATTSLRNANPPSCLFVERSHLARLNDAAYNEVLRGAMAALLAKSSQSPHILDLSCGVPVAGLWALTQGGHSNVLLTVLDGDDNTHKVIRHVASDGTRPVQFASSLQSGTFDIIVADLIAPLGYLDTDAVHSLSTARECLSPNGVVCPQRLQLFAMCIDSAGLRAQTTILGTQPTLGIDVAQYINHHRVGTFIGVDLESLPWERLSGAVHVMDISVDELSPCDLSCRTSRTGIRMLAAGTVTAVIYWFRVHLVDDIAFDNHPDQCRSVESHWRHAAIVLPEDLPVARDDTLQLDACVQSACVGLSIKHVPTEN